MRTELKVVGRKIRHLRVRTKVQGSPTKDDSPCTLR